MTQSSRYSAVAIALHWAIAAAILFMIWLGWNMDDNESRFQLHKSIGITILVLSVARVIWRLMNPPPPLPPGLKRYEKALSRTTHVLFYILILAMPLTGWLVVSTSYDFDIPTVLYGLVSWPDIPGVGFLENESAHGLIANVHSKLAWVLIGLLALHVAGALKHEVFAEQGVLKRMIPGLFGRTERPVPPPSGATIAFGVAILLFLLIAFMPKLFSGGAATSTASTRSGSVTANWTVDYDTSSITFSGTHEGNRYSGEFGEWSADIRFDPDALGTARAIVTLQTGSATANKKLYTDSLKSAEWFAPANYPTATVDLTGFEETGSGYTADAAITIKETTVTVPFSFSLDIQGDEASMTGETTVQRTPLDLGQKSDPGAEWVGEDVVIEVDVTASRIDG